VKNFRNRLNCRRKIQRNEFAEMNVKCLDATPFSSPATPFSSPEHNIRAAIDRHWAASAAGDQVGEHEIYHDDVVCEYPQSGEIINGRQSLQALRSHHPDKPSEFTVRRIVGEGNLWVSEYVINYGGKRVFTVSVMEFRDGKVSHETQYFADSFDAPTWRAQWVARAP
jgi:ketosteroid isomerase-like protein